MTVQQHLQRLKAVYPFLQTPFIISAPMRVFAGAELAVATSRAGGLGFIGPGVRPSDMASKLEKVRALLQKVPVAASPANGCLPVGVGFQLFDGDLDVAVANTQKYRPVATWLFAPAAGQQDVDRWISAIRKTASATHIWLQVGSVAEAVEAASSDHAPDVLVLQGIDAGGHGLRKGAGLLSLLPEVADRLGEMGRDIPLVGAGGVADGRGVAAVLATGVVVGAVMGTRFLASREADISRGYQEDVLRLADGGQSTIRTTLFDQLQGRDDWPDRYDGRAVVNASVRDDQAGMDLGMNKQRFDEVLQSGKNGWGEQGRLTAYVGNAVGLIRDVCSVQEIIESARLQARSALKEAVGCLI